MELSDILDRCHTLRLMDPLALSERERIRSIMNGGVDGIYAVMAWDLGSQNSGRATRQQIADTYGIDLPVVNLVASSMRKMAQSIGRPPTLKAPLADDEEVRRKWEKRTAIVRGWSQEQEMDLQFPMLGRWLPGYSQIMWKLKNRTSKVGRVGYPYAEIVDPYDVYPGWFGPDQEPSEVCRVRKVPINALKEAYGEAYDEIYAKLQSRRTGQPIISASPTTGTMRMVGWEGPQTGIEVLEYYHADGTEYVIPEIEMRLMHVPNPLESGPAFTFRKKFDFDRQLSHYHHVIGLMSMMAKINIIGLVQAEDSAFRETNIIGEMAQGEYERGRFAVNMFEPGTRIEKPTGDPANQIWAQADRLENQLRVGAGYDVAQDGRSANSYATGSSVRELGQAAANEVREYQMTLRYATESIDSKRLEWAEALWASERRKVFDMTRPNQTYKPKTDIKGDFRTRRVYGAMATWDDATKAVTGLQYLQAGVFDVETIQEGVDGLENTTQILTRNRARRAEETLFSLLSAPPEARDPATVMALVEIMKNPDGQQTILEKYLTPEEPAMTPEQEQFAMAGAGGPPGMEAAGVSPEAVTSVLSRLEADKIGGGVQTVGQL
jgi:hypothetical protein